MEFQYFLDMDQCLTDFRGHFEDVFGIHPKDYRSGHAYDEYLGLIEIKGVEFWSQMKWMADGQDWWNYIREAGPIKIISYPLQMEGCIPGKLEWCKRELGLAEDDCILTTEKYAHVTAHNDLLIDDHMGNVTEWRKAGGQAIQHISAETTIKIVEALRDITFDKASGDQGSTEEGASESTEQDKENPGAEAEASPGE